MNNIFLIIFVAFVFSIFNAPIAMAQSWWGDGARSNEWVLANDGAIIKYKIVANGATDRYKAILYENGKVIEWENGKTGLFDDPKNSTYIVKAVRGGINKSVKTSKGGKKILSSGTISAHPGETIQVTLNDLTDEVTVVSNSRAVAKRPVN